MSKTATLVKPSKSELKEHSGKKQPVATAGTFHGAGNVVAASSQKVECGLDLNDPWFGETVAEEAALPEPGKWYCIVKQIGIKRKVGSIIIPDSVQSDQQWSHGLCLVVRVGPAVYRGSKFRDMELDADKHGPKVGDIWTFQARQVRYRVKIDGEDYIEMPDDALVSRINPHELHRYSFMV